MQRIKYNIATNKQIDHKKLTIISSAIVIISIIFIFISIQRLWGGDSDSQDIKRRSIQSRQEIETLKKQTQDYQKGINKIKTRWQTRVNFANSLIKGKSLNVVKALDILEQHLPEGVFITHVTYDVEAKFLLQIKIAANSLSRLGEAYKKFSKYKPIKQNETEERGLFMADLILRVKK
jgi:hypothetical protein